MGRPNSRSRLVRIFLYTVPLFLIAGTLSGCTVQHVLNPRLPDAEGTVWVGQEVSQPFLSPADGLNQLSIGIVPRVNSAEGAQPGLAGGATVEIRFAPQFDDRFSEGSFHEWSDEHEWVGELIDDREVGQRFFSPYASLDGITLRVATYGADLSPGTGTIDDNGPVSVLELPIDGQELTELPSGSEVQIEGAAEGWALIQLDGGLRGFIPLDRLAEAPDPARVNDGDVVLTLYQEPDLTEVRRATINAAEMYDNSHVTFEFEPLIESDGATYRFVLTSPESTPGNAITFRYASSDVYAEGERLEHGELVNGDLIFEPRYAEGDPIFAGELDSFDWYDLTDSLQERFDPIEGTEDRFLEIVVRPGDEPLSVLWSLIRPQGGEAIIVDGDSSQPGGGLVFNVGYRSDIPIARLGVESAHGVYRSTRQDPAFFTLYSLSLIAVVVWGLRIRAKGHQSNGR